MDQAKHNLYGLSLCLALSALILSVLVVPRNLGFSPSVLGLVFTGLYALVYKVRPRLFLPAIGMGVGIVALALASCLWALYPDAAWERTGKIAVVILPSLLLISVVAYIPLNHIGKYIRFIPMAYIIFLILLNIEIWFNYPFFRLTRGLDFGMTVKDHELNRTTVCAVLMLLPVSVLAMEFFKGKQKLAMVFLTLLALPFLLKTDSQSAQLAALVMLAFFFLFPYRCRYSWFTLMAAFVVGILCAPWLASYLFTHHAATLHSLPGLGGGGAHVGNRMEVWDFISRFALQQPLAGFGIDVTKNVQTFDSKEIYQSGTYILHPHNFFLQVWIEFGALGAVLLSASLIYILNTLRARLSIPAARIALPSLMALISVGLTGYGLWQAWWLGLIILVITFIIIAIRVLDQKAV